jgi:tRNA 2-selenouridine synthase
VRERERESERERGYSAIIDVRTPAEFAVDHVPGAINLPVLSDLERHQVGLLFASEHFQGRKLGAQLISANIAQLLAAHFADKPSAYCPLIYCWRGGQRSNSLAHVLCEVGFRCSVLQGGYRAFRRSVVRLISRAPSSLNFRVITGPTGSGKTALLHYLLRKGHQILDLEALANHRGSVLGATATAQPSQKAFESLLALALLSLRPDSPVFVEDEAPYIGALHIPSPLWRYVQRTKHECT